MNTPFLGFSVTSKIFFGKSQFEVLFAISVFIFFNLLKFEFVAFQSFKVKTGITEFLDKSVGKKLKPNEILSCWYIFLFLLGKVGFGFHLIIMHLLLYVFWAEMALPGRLGVVAPKNFTEAPIDC